MPELAHLRLHLRSEPPNLRLRSEALQTKGEGAPPILLPPGPAFSVSRSLTLMHAQAHTLALTLLHTHTCSLTQTNALTSLAPMLSVSHTHALSHSRTPRGGMTRATPGVGRQRLCPQESLPFAGRTSKEETEPNTLQESCRHHSARQALLSFVPSVPSLNNSVIRPGWARRGLWGGGRCVPPARARV